MDDKLLIVLNSIDINDYKTSGVLADQLKLSERTVRSRIKEINYLIEKNGATIISKPHFGHKLVINDYEMWQEYLKNEAEDYDSIPADSDSRINYILLKLLKTNDYIKLEDLSDELYVSVKTLSNEMKKIEFILSQFRLSLEKKPYYGTKVIGNEFDCRNCFLQTFLLPNRSIYHLDDKQRNGIKEIADMLMKFTKKEHIRFSEVAFQNTVLYIFVSLMRMEKGSYIIDTIALDEYDISKEVRIISNIYQQLVYKYKLKFNIPKEEIAYAAIYLAGKRFMGNDGNLDPNVVISDEIDGLVTKILDTLYHLYQVEFRDDFNLRIMLNQHFIPLSIRLKYGIPIEKNTVLDEVKEKHLFAFTMAQSAGNIISEFYDAPISDDEIACIAIYLALSMEERTGYVKKKKNILLVCVSGRASSQLLMYRFKQEFNDYIQSLEVCGMYDFENYDLTGIDFIFTTVPIYKKVNVPMMIISDFLQKSEVMSVRDFLRIGDLNFLDNYYKKKYFFKDIEGKTKEDVIYNLCREIRKVTVLPDEFEQSVLKRESFGPTDFGNLVAIPHPCEMMDEETIVSVAVLKEQIFWTNNEVRVVVLTALGPTDKDDIQKFYEVTTRFLMSEEMVQNLIENPDYDSFIHMISDSGLKK
ncbi:MAG: PRD domain-containing protein [Holdemanella sp.]|nr:PRD domain-containing protein [Holdemanella sp.]